MNFKKLLKNTATVVAHVESGLELLEQLRDIWATAPDSAQEQRKQALALLEQIRLARGGSMLRDDVRDLEAS